MHALVIKTSSLGDVIHTFPAITDVARERPDTRFDWVVEEDFVELPTWHPAIARVVPVSLRRWRRNLSQSLFSKEVPAFRRQLRQRSYDVVIDAQGLIKSAVLGCMAKGPVHGFARDSAREQPAALAYAHRHHVDWGQHAITRLRQLFAQVFGYPVPEQEPDYGLDTARFRREHMPPYVVFLHGTNWVSKQWPEAYWSKLAGVAVANGYEVRLPWGTSAEHLRAERLASSISSGTQVLARTSLSDLGTELANARGVVGVDSGLVHLAAALATPSVTLYGATDARLTGTSGQKQTVLKADYPCSPCLERRCRFDDEGAVFPPCYQQLTPATVWGKLAELMDE